MQRESATTRLGRVVADSARSQIAVADWDVGPNAARIELINLRQYSSRELSQQWTRKCICTCEIDLCLARSPRGPVGSRGWCFSSFHSEKHLSPLGTHSIRALVGSWLDLNRPHRYGTYIQSREFEWQITLLSDFSSPRDSNLTFPRESKVTSLYLS